MGFIKCPRCELNYIQEEEQYCSVCKREMKGEVHEDPFELCSICNENPVVPGQELCAYCLKEFNHHSTLSTDDTIEHAPASIEIDSVSTMEEIELDTLPEDMPAEIGEQISLEEEQSKEDMDDEEDEEI